MNVLQVCANSRNVKEWEANCKKNYCFQLIVATLLALQLLTDLCSGMDLSQTTAFGAPSEGTPCRTKT